MSGPLRILALDDSPAAAELLTETLVGSGLRIEVERVTSKDAFAHALTHFSPHVVLADHCLSDFNALAALQLVHLLRPSAPVIVVTGSVDDELVVACLRAGAEDIVLKGNLTRLRPAIEAGLLVRRPLERLTPRQLEVFRLVTEGDSTREIARRLRLSVKTVETHRGDIMKRLGIHDLVGLVRYAVRVGLLSSDGDGQHH
jgi:DNA-binding NarL/FixJ family response regulator